MVYFDSGKLRYSHRFADLFSGAPRICLFFSNDQLNSDLLCRKMETGAQIFRRKLPSCHRLPPPPTLLSERNQLGQKKKNRPSSNSEGGRHCCDSKSQVLNTLKNVVVRFLVTHFFDPTHFVFVNSTEKYFFEKRLLCKQECIWPKSTKIHTPAQKAASKYLIPEN